MKNLAAGIIFIMVPLFISAQTRDAQDPSVTAQKINRLEKENLQLKKQTADLQRSVQKITEAMAKEQATFKTFDSVVQANRDTVTYYSSKITAVQRNQWGTAYDLYIRSIVFIAFLAGAIILMIILQWTHRRQHAREFEEFLSKLKLQREEREKRIDEVIALINRNQESLMAFKTDTEGNFVKERAEMFRQEEKLKQLVSEKSGQTEIILSQKITHMAEEHYQSAKQTEERIAGLEEKIADSGRLREELINNYTQQFNTLRKDTAELINILTKELKEIKETKDPKEVKKKPA
jgi:septal ring factor EnvC (AmiA/AmiB activator)